MIAQVSINILIGLYLGGCIYVSAWRQASGAAGGRGLWIALFGIWSLMALPDLLQLTGPVVYLSAVIWFVISVTLVFSGSRNRAHHRLPHWIWILGPVDALRLLLFWSTLARMRSAEKRTKAVLPPERAGRQRREAIESVVELGETTVGEVMIPRSEMTLLDENATISEWIGEVEKSRHRSIPVYGEDQDEVKGYVSIETIFQDHVSNARVGDFLHELRFVPESMRCDDLLRELIAQGEQIALVVDEFGGTAGMVSDQDLFQILLGEINRQNPFEGRIFQLDSDTYLADGHYRIDNYNEWAPESLPDGDYETLAGYILHRLGRIPGEGERIKSGLSVLEVIRASERKIHQVRIELPEGAMRGPLLVDRK